MGQGPVQQAGHHHLDPPAAARGITVLEVVVAPDGARLHALTRLAARGVLTVSEVRPHPLERAGAAMAQVRHGAHGAAIVLLTGLRDGSSR